MTELRTGEGPKPLETTRIGGGASARLGAVVVAAALVAVVWIGISGRPPMPVRTAAPVAVAATPLPTEIQTTTPSASPNPPEPTSAPATPAPPAPPAPTDTDLLGYSVVAMLGGRRYAAPLAESEPGHLSGTFPVPIPPPATRGTIELAEDWFSDTQLRRVSLATWDLQLESLSAASGREYVVLDQIIRPRPSQRSAPLPVRNGYRIRVHAQSGLTPALVRVDVYVGDGRPRIVGEDGLFGWPTFARIDPPRQLPLLVPRAYNSQCRWDIGPPAAAPQHGPDESECRG